jgi:hypothetical protein
VTRPGGANPGLARFAFLHLLGASSEPLGQIFLAHTQQNSPQSQLPGDVLVDVVWLLGESAAREFSVQLRGVSFELSFEARVDFSAAAARPAADEMFKRGRVFLDMTLMVDKAGRPGCISTAPSVAKSKKLQVECARKVYTFSL